MPPEAYNIKKRCFTKCPQKRITSKTMLYKMPPEAYNIENDGIQNGL